ncbi:FecR family protein [Nitrosomonas marina]|uniref:FecR family protein n=1 Tax=Nitrosomonas marina TaxID=917 RepID=A0A1H8C526_9PROT|nr:FecR family protein [Nitrosomonas marina]SEM90183.1 FecR family protein [Nitrosomonas marina]
MTETTQTDQTAGSNVPSLSEQAAEWAVCMSGKHVSPQQQADFKAWLAQDSRHGEAYAQVETLWHSITPKKHRNNSTIKSLLGIALLLGCLYGLPFSVWLADERTGTGEIRHITLNDGSRVTLDSNSAADIAYDSHQRRIFLHRGRILAYVAPESSIKRPPFIVETRDGSAQALGTRFIVNRTGTGSTVTVLESQVTVANRSRPHRFVTLQAGQSIRFGSEELQQPVAAPSFAASWAQARLIYQNTPLGKVVHDLTRYRSGYLGVNEQAAQLHFTGVLPADAPEEALNILKNALPVSITRYGDWIVRIETSN